MRAEREFLHDLAGPLATLSLLLEALSEEARNSFTGEDRLKLARAQGLVEKASALLAERRDELREAE